MGDKKRVRIATPPGDRNNSAAVPAGPNIQLIVQPTFIPEIDNA